MKKNLAFTLILFILFVATFAIHLKILPDAKEFLIKSYVLNAIVASASLVLLGYGMRRRTNNLAYLYLFTVALKLIIYLTFFNPQFQVDGNVTREEFFMFFVPYALGLLSEIVLLLRRFN